MHIHIAVVVAAVDLSMYRQYVYAYTCMGVYVYMLRIVSRQLDRCRNDCSSTCCRHSATHELFYRGIIFFLKQKNEPYVLVTVFYISTKTYKYVHTYTCTRVHKTCTHIHIYMYKHIYVSACTPQAQRCFATCCRLNATHELGHQGMGTVAFASGLFVA